MTLLEILYKNKATLYIALESQKDSWDNWFAHIHFEEGKIKVNIWNDEGGTYLDDESDPIPYDWFVQIKNFVDELTSAKHLPEQTLNMFCEEIKHD